MYATKITLFFLGLLIFSACRADITTGVDESAKLPYWEWRDINFELRLIQRLPDQSRAFFMGRKFSKDNAELIAQNCIFQTIFKNKSDEKYPAMIDYNLNDWKIISDGKARAIKTRESWLQELKSKNVSQSSLIALEWGLLPTKQKYISGDYNWGMISFGLPPESHFDLNIKILVNGQPVNAIIPAIECAPDLHIEPEN